MWVLNSRITQLGTLNFLSNIPMTKGGASVCSSALGGLAYVTTPCETDLPCCLPDQVRELSSSTRKLMSSSRLEFYPQIFCGLF